MRVVTGGTDLSTGEGGNEDCERWAKGVHRLMGVRSPRRAPKRIDALIMSSASQGASHPELVTLRSVAISGKGFTGRLDVHMLTGQHSTVTK